MKIKVKIIIIAYLIILSLIPVNPIKIVYSYSDLPDGFNEAAQNEYLVLYCNQEKNAIGIMQKSTGAFYQSCLSEESPVYIEESSSKIREDMTAFLKLKYTKGYEFLNTKTTLSEGVEINYKPLKNGIIFEYAFTKQEIEFNVNIWLEENSLCVSIPIEDINEMGEYKFVKIELLEMFGCSERTDNGYFVYPDGCGALYNFREEDSKYAESYKFDIYSGINVELQEIQDKEEQEYRNFMLPVFGVKNNGYSYIATAYEGDCSSTIIFNPSGYKYGLNRIFYQFTYRTSYKDIRNLQGVEKTYFNENMIKETHAVRYLFLEGENQDYGQMAVEYRNYIENSIKDIEIQGYPILMSFLMGVKEERILFDKYKVMTSFKDAENIVGNFISNGINDITVKLLGYSREGYGMFPDKFSVSNKLGGKKGYQNLYKYLNANGIDMLLQANIINALSQDKHYSKASDIIFDHNGKAVSNDLLDEFLISPDKYSVLFDKLFKINDKKYPLDGLCIESAGQILHANSIKRNVIQRFEARDYTVGLIDNIKDKYGKTAVEGGNIYAAKNADLLYNIPSSDSGYMITDKVIPFYQIVLHGLIPYYESPGNLSHDIDNTHLKWVEYGYLPYFELTENDNTLLTGTNGEWLYSSKADVWIDYAVDIYKDMEENTGYLADIKMVGHKCLKEDLYAVYYEDGSIIYVNYSSSVENIGSKFIMPESYLVVKGGK